MMWFPEAINQRPRDTAKSSGHRNFSDTLITSDTFAENPRWPNPPPLGKGVRLDMRLALW